MQVVFFTKSKQPILQNTPTTNLCCFWK